MARAMFKRWPLIVVAGFAGAILATGFDLADRLLRITDRFHFTTSEALTLARESEKSKSRTLSFVAYIGD
jgi:hypothetical protein